MEIISERASVVKDEKSLSIVITSCTDKKKILAVQLILILWIMGGAVIVFNYKKFSADNAKVMLLVWMAFWLYFLYVMGKAWMWLRFGKEVIKVQDGKFYYKRDVRGRGWVHTFAVENIRDLFSPEDKTPSWLKTFGGDYWSIDATSIAFHADDRQFHFGFRLSEKEKEKVMKLLKQYFGRK